MDDFNWEKHCVCSKSIAQTAAGDVREVAAIVHLIASEKFLHSAPENVVKLALRCVILILDHFSASSILAQLPDVETLQEKPASTFN